MEDLTDILSLFERNVQKLQLNLSAYQSKVNHLCQTLNESWSHMECVDHVDRVDNRIISVYDGLLRSVSQINEYIIKLNLHININRSVGVFQNQLSIDYNNNNNGNHTNQHGIEVGDLDATIKRENDALQQQLVLKQAPERICGNGIKPEISSNLVVSTVKQAPPIPPRRNVNPQSIPAATAPIAPLVLPISGRQTKLLAPKGGRETSSKTMYDELSKNISCFENDSVVQVTMMHLNISEKCIYVAKWGEETKPLKKLLACQVPMQQLDQLPDFGEIFAVYDAQEQIIPRVLINAHTEGGGYEAYLLDYGEHIHLDDTEVIFSLPNELKTLPAEAIRCYVRNRDVAHMRPFTYKEVRLRVLDNNGNDLEVEILESGQAEATMSASTHGNTSMEIDDASTKEEIQSTQKWSPQAMKMLEEIEHGTSDALEAVLGYKPTDDQRICRHYDPKINGCFKGSNCRLLHQPFAPHGATKDRELAEALPESIYVTAATRELGSIVRVLVTFISSPTKVYVQFMDETPPLVWGKKELHVSQRSFKRPPRVLDMVMALYSDDCYYRAQIVEELDGVFKIFYVDYGNTEFVTIKSLAQCHLSASLKPHRAINCFIGGIKCSSLASQRHSAECVEFLKSKILNAQLDVLLVNQMPGGYVIKFLDRYADVLNQMIKRGYVEPITDDLEPSDSGVDP